MKKISVETQFIIDFIFLLIFSGLNVFFPWLLMGGQFLIAFILSIFIYVPTIYLIIILSKRYNRQNFDISKRGIVFDILLLCMSICSFLSFTGATLGLKIYWDYFIIGFPVLFLIPLYITLIILVCKNYVKTKEIIKNAAEPQYFLTEKERLTFVDVFITLFFVPLGIFSFSTILFYGGAFNNLGLAATPLFAFCCIILICGYFLVRLCMKVYRKEMSFSIFDTSFMIAQIAGSACILIGTLYCFFDKLDIFKDSLTLPIWIIYFISVGFSLILLISNVIFIIVTKVKHNKAANIEKSL